MKKELIQNIKIAVYGILTLLLLLLTVLELLPQKQTGLVMREPLTVSAQLIDTASGTYETALSGVLFNESDETVTAERLTVTVSDGTTEKKIDITLTDPLPPRTRREIRYSEINPNAFTTVTDVSAQIGTETHSVTNVEPSAIGLAAIILIALLAVIAFLLYRSILVRKYMNEEKKLNG